MDNFKKKMNIGWILSVIFICYFLFFGDIASACNVPVFRYALERWSADPYQVQIYYAGELNSEQKDAINQLKRVSFSQDSTANIYVHAKNIDGKENLLSEMDVSPSRLPWMILKPPDTKGANYAIWAGPLTKQNVEYILDSPSRSLIAERLLKGEMAVWLFLDGADSLENEKAARLLENYLVTLSRDLKVPETGFDINGNPVDIDEFQDVDIKLSMVRVSRNDPREAIFVNMLLATEADLSEYDVPMAFPIFGRGRSLYSLIGAGINENMIDNACRSINGWCSCEIKAQNPGNDLLFSAEWSKYITVSQIPQEEMPPLTGLSGFLPETKTVEVADEVVLPDSGQQQQSLKDSVLDTFLPESQITTKTNFDKTSSPLLGRNLLLVMGLGLFTIVFVSIWFTRKGKKRV